MTRSRPRQLSLLALLLILPWILVLAAALGRGGPYQGFFARHPAHAWQGAAQGGLFLLLVALPLLIVLFQPRSRRGPRWVAASVLVYCCFVPTGEALLLSPAALWVGGASLDPFERSKVAKWTSRSVFVLVAASLALAPWLTWFHTPGYGARFCGPFTSPNTYYPLGVLGFALAQASGRRGLGKPLGEALSLVSVLLTGSRSGMAAVCACAAASWAASRRLSLAGLAALASGAFLALLRAAGSGGAISVDRSALSRPLLWGFALRQMAETPLLGIGPHGFAHSSFRREMLELHPMMPVEPKNLVLFFLVSYGLLGLAWFIWAATRLGFRWSRLLALVLVAVFFSGLFDSSFAFTPLTLPGTAFLALLLGSQASRPAAWKRRG